MTQDIFIPSPLAEKLIAEAGKQEVTVDEIVAEVIKNYIEKERNNVN